MSPFQKYQAARDAAAALLGLGICGIVLDLAYVAYLWASGESPLDWFAGFLGPAILFVSLPMLGYGVRFARKAARIRPE